MERGCFAKDAHTSLLQIIRAISYCALISAKHSAQAIRSTFFEAFRHLDMQNSHLGEYFVSAEAVNFL